MYVFTFFALVIFSQVLESLTVSLFEELHVVRSGIRLLENDRKYRELTIEIENLKKIDKPKALSLTQQRLQLRFDPSNPPEGMLSEEELKSRGLIVLDRLSERESCLFQLGEGSLSEICEKFQECVVRMFKGVKLPLHVNDSINP